mgnify:CR=1 FL=1
MFAEGLNARNIEAYLNGEDVQDVFNNVVPPDEHPSFHKPFVSTMDSDGVVDTVLPAKTDKAPLWQTSEVDDKWEYNLEGYVLVFGSKTAPRLVSVSTPIPVDNKPNRNESLRVLRAPSLRMDDPCNV